MSHWESMNTTTKCFSSDGHALFIRGHLTFDIPHMVVGTEFNLFWEPPLDEETDDEWLDPPTPSLL